MVPGKIVVATCALVAALAIVQRDRAPAAENATSIIDRGKYLTHGAGQCIDCHGQDMAGGPAPPGPPGVPWAKTSPSLVGLKMFPKDADAVTFLMTTKLPDGNQALRPMPRFEFNAADASAIVAYLRSLTLSP